MIDPWLQPLPLIAILRGLTPGEAIASGFGIGSALYAPGRGVAEVAPRARAFAQAWAMLAQGR
jgi:hypothetical protein